MIRRTFLKRAGATAAVGALSRAPFASSQSTSRVLELRRDPAQPPLTVPGDFVGLGYEMSSVAPLGLLAVENTRYVQLLRNLGPSGVLRFGGIVADSTTYDPQGTTVATPKRTVVTQASVRQARQFLDRVGWRAIWSVNFGQGTLPEAIAEAREVAGILGDRLLALELGNEVENYGRGKTPLRTAPYSYETFRAEYAKWYAAILAAVPGMRFAAPDTAESVDWVEAMAKDAHGTVQLLTTHYYRNNQHQGSAGQLEASDPELTRRLRRLRGASQGSGIPWRMCETNSFSGGGLPGVSDTLLGALWTLDYMLLLASSGCAGVNMETGVNQLGFISSYSPIQDDGRGINSAGAPYYGMLACAQALAHGSEVLAISLDGAPAGVTAYALGRNGKPTALVAINRDPAMPVSVRFGELGLTGLRAMHLTGAGIPSHRVTFGGTIVAEDGTWTPGALRTVRDAHMRVEPMSATVLVSGAPA